jgi:dienelactone hydrolase
MPEYRIQKREYRTEISESIPHEVRYVAPSFPKPAPDASMGDPHRPVDLGETAMKNVLPILVVLAAAGPAQAQRETKERVDTPLIGSFHDAEAGSDAKLKSKTVDYTHGNTRLKGYLVYDESIAGKRPGVLVVHEWWGLNDYARKRADLLAKSGYVAFAVDMYGAGKLTEHSAEAGEWASQVRANVKNWQQRGLAGLEILKEHELVDSRRVAAIGYCFGGATVLQLAYSGADLAAVVSFHGALPAPTAEQEKQIKAKVLICHGAADGFIQPAQIDALRAALERGNVDWQMVSYGQAKHSFTNPDAGKSGVEGLEYNEKADKRSWRDMRQLFDEIFGPRRATAG